MIDIPLFCTGAISILFNIFIKLRFLKSPIDYDSALHIYFAVLRSQKVSFYSSYALGIKWALPRIYSLFGGLLSQAPYKFRYLNLLISSLLLLIFFSRQHLFNQNLLLLGLTFAIVLNSSWINHTTSAIEYFEGLSLVLLMIIPHHFSFLPGILLQSILVLFMTGGLKLTSILYIFPTVFLWPDQFAIVWPVKMICLTVASLWFIFVYHKAYQTVSPVKYAKTRGFFTVKNQTLFRNPMFILLLIGLIFEVFMSENVYSKVWVMCAIVILIAQKSFVFYFYLPLVCGLFFGIDPNQCQLPLTPYILISVIIAYLIFQLRPMLKMTPRQYDIYFREKFVVGSENWSKYLENRDADVEWLKIHIPKSASVYLWGSHIALLLLSGLRHCGNSFYNHNHLFHWSKINDKLKHCLDVVNIQKVGYIIQSGVMYQFTVPKQLENYEKIFSSPSMQVYKRK